MTPPRVKPPTKLTNTSFPIVGIGTSAGGLEALGLFFKDVPLNSGMAFVVVQHLDPTRAGIMHELLQRITELKVFQVTDQLKVKPNCVYVIPPNKSMSLLNGKLHLFEPVESRGLRLPIDIFFRSLANDLNEKSIGVVLSGMGSDGSLGLKAIKEQHGLVLVQDPATAKFNGMPGSAIEAVIADIVAPVGELAGKLIDLLKFPHSTQKIPEIEIKNKSKLEKIILLLRQQCGHDFSLYKKNTLFRRIERRKGIHQIEKTDNYVRFLQENPGEVEILFKELLIGVTSFFRDDAIWKKLKEDVLPAAISKMPERHVLRAWVPGCSTGEEAYSWAMLFKEIMEETKNSNPLTLQIFASDIDKDAIDKARKGVFPKNIVSDVSSARINRFFTEVPEGFRINNTIREMVVFAPQNVIKDPPFTKLDIVSCRNLLIYMEPELQKNLISLFNYSLKDNGIMLLGSAETLGSYKGGFVALDAKHKIFERAAGIQDKPLIDFPSSFYHPNIVASEEKAIPEVTENIQTLADRILLDKFSPASVLVNSSGDILYITGRTGKYLEPVAGKANWNIHVMAREKLRNRLPEAFRKAQNTFDPVILHNIQIGAGKNAPMVDVTVQCIESPKSIRGMVMVVFADVPFVETPDIVSPGKAKAGSAKRQRELEIELQRCHEEMQSTREEMQTSQEELKSTNEELQSTNEELQSTNEELTTSKEEMQSLNEELQTVNIELQSKISDYSRANDDMKNLLNSTEIITIFLDREMNIRRFTDNATSLFKLRETDIGRPFTDLVSDLNYPEIASNAHKVIQTLLSCESEISTKDARWFKVRIMPYRTLDDRIDRLVMTFFEITTAKKLEIKLQDANDALHKKM